MIKGVDGEAHGSLMVEFNEPSKPLYRLVRLVNRPVEKVQAMITTSRDIENEDTGILNIKWRNGALGSLSTTMLTYPENFEGSITILGEKGTVRVEG